MKSLIVLVALGFLHIHLAGTKALLAVFDDVVTEGQSYPVEWLSDAEDVSDQTTLIVIDTS